MLETVKIEVSKRFVDGKPKQWEVDVYNIDGSYMGTAVDVTFDGVMELAKTIISGDSEYWEEEHNTWVDFEGYES